MHSILSILFLLLFLLLYALGRELVFALLWGVKKRDLLLVVKINTLTALVVGLGYLLATGMFYRNLLYFTLFLEIVAFLVEGWIYATHSKIRFPWAFSLCANLFSIVVGHLFFAFIF